MSEDFGWSLGVVLRSYHEMVTAVLGDLPHGPRGYQTLAEVAQGKQPSQLALATHLGIDRTVMTYLVDDLAAAGLVERRSNPEDRRQRQVIATEQGRVALESLCRRVCEVEEVLLGGLPKADRDVFRTLLGRAADGITDLARTADPCQVVAEALGEDA